MVRKILITGAEGQLGKALQFAFADQFTILPTARDLSLGSIKNRNISQLLYKVAANTVRQILNADSGEAKLFAALVNLNEIIAIGKVAKQLPGFARNVASTSKLIFTGAKTKSSF